MSHLPYFQFIYGDNNTFTRAPSPTRDDGRRCRNGDQRNYKGEIRINQNDNKDSVWTNSGSVKHS